MRPYRFLFGTWIVATLACGSNAPSEPQQNNGESEGPDASAPSGPAGSNRSPDASSPSSPGKTADGGGPTIPYPIPDWQTAAPSDVGLDSNGLDAAAEVAEANGSYCLLVLRHGLLVYEKYWQGTDATTANKSWSLAKSYTSTLVGIAIDRGEIKSLDESAADFVPSWQGTDKAAITIRNLLSMTSGLDWNAFDDYVTMATLASNDTEYSEGKSLASPPGSGWTYDNEAVQIFEPIFRAATGHTLDDYAQLYLWSKIGMSATWAHDPSGNPTAYANVLASCRDHARFGYLYMHHGNWAGEQVVSTSYVSQAIVPSQSYNRAYGFLFWLNGQTPAEDALNEAWPGDMVPFAPADLFAARGFGNQFIDVIPSLDLMVVRFGADPMTVFDPVALATDSKFGKHDDILKPILGAVTD